MPRCFRFAGAKVGIFFELTNFFATFFVVSAKKVLLLQRQRQKPLKSTTEMSLIKCPECDHNVSSKAPFCPNCGVLIEGNIKRCPVCGGYSLMAATQCAYCHTKFAPHQTRPSQDNAEQHGAAPETTSQTVEPAPSTQVAGDAVAATPAKGGESALPKSDASATPASDPTPAVQVPVGIDPRTQESNKGGAPWYLLIIAIVLIAVGGFFYWEHVNQEASEERAYEYLRDCNDPLNYEDFIARYPTSRHIEDVRQRLQELRHEETTWQSICQKSDVDLFREFIGSHPSSPYKKVALHKIDSLDWCAARNADNSSAYDAYIRNHDNGEYIDDAFARFAEAQKREEQACRDSLAAAAARQRDSIAAVTPPDEVMPI